MTETQTMTEPPVAERTFDEEDEGFSGKYIRDSKRLTTYLVPLPKPQLSNNESVPQRFLIYTPPPPGLRKPMDGEKEAKSAKVQRKWQETCHDAKSEDIKSYSWKGVKGKVSHSINTGVMKTKDSNLAFVERIRSNSNPRNFDPDHAHKGEKFDSSKDLSELHFVYPPTIDMSQDELRAEFARIMTRTEAKTKRNTLIGAGLLPIAAGIDGVGAGFPLFEIDAVWLYINYYGRKTSKNVNQRMREDSPESDALNFSFVVCPALSVFQDYLAAQCHAKDATMFPEEIEAPSESEVLDAMGWKPSTSNEATADYEKRERMVAEADIKAVMLKGAKEWSKWCKQFQKKPEKALKA